MKGIKKLTAVILSLLLLTSACLVVSGCTPEEEKYDVTAVIVRQEAGNVSENSSYMSVTGPMLERWVVTPYTAKLNIEMEYDGKYYVYYVCLYNVSEHPELGDVWFKYFGYRSRNVFAATYVLRPKDSKKIDAVCDRGEYIISIESSDKSSLFNYRKFSLNITVI